MFHIFINRCFIYFIPGSRTLEASDRRWSGQRGVVLPRVGQHVLGSQLPQPQPLEHSADVGAEGRTRARPAGLRAHGDCAHTE